MEMIRLKTSVLLGCACKLGAMLAGANDYECKAFYDYGIKLGLAFQLEDDLLDTFGDAATFGKSIGGDIINDKKTWLLISALNSDKHDDVCRMIGHDIDPAEKIAHVKAIYEALELPQRCDELISKHIDSAIDALRPLEMVPGAMEFFTEIAKNSLHRTH
jgi:geranylgeranyl diphosphate synthase type II